MSRARTALALVLWLLAGTAFADGAAGDRHRAGQPDGRTGAEVYKQICQGCHMPDGKGATGAGKYPALAGDPALASADFAAITVLYGRRNMPNFAGTFNFGAGFFVLARLDDEQVAAVVNFLRTNFGNRFKGTISAAQVKSLRESLPAR